MINRIAYENLENDEHALDQESGKIDDVSDNSNNTKKDSLEFETAGSMKKRKIRPSPIVSLSPLQHDDNA